MYSVQSKEAETQGTFTVRFTNLLSIQHFTTHSYTAHSVTHKS